jgi:hypothetical protein
MTDEKFSPALIPARMVNEYVYCPRLLLGARLVLGTANPNF